MTAVEHAASLCRVFEGYRSAPYLCPAGVPTIGYGSTHYPSGKSVKLSDAPVSKEQAETLLMYELSKIEPWVVALCPTLTDVHRRAAILDWVYNLGVGRLRASTMRKRINERDWEAARRELLRWDKAGGKVLPGLTKRRAAEALLLRGE